MSSCNSHHHVEEQKNPSEPLPIISVDGVVIEESALANELQYHQNPDFELVVQQAGQALVVKQLLIAYAIKQGIEVNEKNEEEVLQKLMSEEVSYSDPSDENCFRYFQNNKRKFTTAPLMEVDHILLAAEKEDLPASEVAKNQATDIINQLKVDPFLFSELASQYSACPSKKTGGSLGQISKGQTVPEFERQLEKLAQGLASKPLESRYGFHVVNVIRKVDGKELGYSMVEDKVRGYLTHRASYLAIQAFIQNLVAKADIQGIEIRFVEENIVV